MTYNYLEIGKRLRKERKGIGLSQDKLANCINDDVAYCDRGKVIDWEKGREIPSLDVFLYLCEMYDCELGYLLCEYDCKTRPKTDIAAETGLSEQAIDILSGLADTNSDLIAALNALITSRSFKDLLQQTAWFMNLTEQDARYRSEGVDFPESWDYAENERNLKVARFSASEDLSRSLDNVGSKIAKHGLEKEKNKN